MKILVINCGSSSLKYQLIDMDGEKVLCKGLCERIGMESSMITHEANGHKATTPAIFLHSWFSPNTSCQIWAWVPLSTRMPTRSMTLSLLLYHQVLIFLLH